MKFKKGDRVKVVRKGLKTSGLTGVVNNIEDRGYTIVVHVTIPVWGSMSYFLFLK